MRVRPADAMPIFVKYGPTDFFITFTANRKWPQITENLQPGQQAYFRLDLTARGFKLKLKSLIIDLTVQGVFEKLVAHVYTIEFQRRGFPHAHILLVLRTEDKFSNSESIDRTVREEIPSPEECPRLHEIVTKMYVAWTLRQQQL
ncbi:hypothetical protein AVEN_152168-1 [Araneus ventricosus]|uniref:Helitron helicase-like domain-containing protein n=1 Tax=Araneus ventricosus TaxID=182803 RepID=A0A4Y2HKT2_ARAVE|nr:hypothetical protein AVEN_152168-1 [Araneus ventricosus]